MLPDKKQDELEKKFLESDEVFLVRQLGKHVKLAARNPGTRVGGVFTLEYASEPLAKDFADKFRSRKTRIFRSENELFNQMKAELRELLLKEILVMNKLAGKIGDATQCNNGIRHAILVLEEGMPDIPKSEEEVKTNGQRDLFEWLCSNPKSVEASLFFNGSPLEKVLQKKGIISWLESDGFVNLHKEVGLELFTKTKCPYYQNSVEIGKAMAAKLRANGVNAFDRTKLDALVEKLRKDAGITDEAKPFFSFGRDISHHGEPCFFCGFTGNVHGEGRYIHSPLSELSQDDDSITEAQVMAAAIVFCGKCEGIMDKLDVLEMDFD